MSKALDPDPFAGSSGTAPQRQSDIQRLKPKAVALLGVLFMAVATAAPITAMVGNVPIVAGFVQT